MKNLSSHYETLNVSKDASQDEIRASYVSLCKMFHSDATMVAELSRSFEILKAAAVETETLPELPALPEIPVVTNISEILEMKRRQREEQDREASRGSSLKVAAMIALVVGISAFGIFSYKNTLSRIKVLDVEGIIAKTTYVRPLTAPNGSAFPETTSYVSCYALGKNDGNSSLLVNNTKNDHDVYLKLISLDNNKSAAVRHVLIKGKTDFKIENLATGNYEIQYMDLVAGLVGRSIIFSVEESKTETGIKATNLVVNLRTAISGVLNVENVSIAEFNSLASL